jgi:hypothetical protein
MTAVCRHCGSRMVDMDDSASAHMPGVYCGQCIDLAVLGEPCSDCEHVPGRLPGHSGSGYRLTEGCPPADCRCVDCAP